MLKIIVNKGDYQDRFLNSKAKFAAMISGVGTGKTACLLTKVYQYCEDWPGTTALIVRREFTDLRDSLMKDFESYFEVKISSEKNYRLPNGSSILFRHAAELNVIRNLNLGFCAVEQAEEFDDDTQFQMLRDRLRQNNGAPVRPLCIIANARGHNWCWKLWINGAKSVEEIDGETGQYFYKNEEYEAVTATTFANSKNLPGDFVADQRRKEVEAPNFYKQFCLNSFEEMEQDDFVFTFSELMTAKNKDYMPRQGFNYRVMGVDVARYGNDLTACVIFEQIGAMTWRLKHIETWGQVDLNYTVGRILATAQLHNVDETIVDEDGLGGGVLDFIVKGRQRNDFQGFRNKPLSYDDNRFFCNNRTDGAFKLKELFSKGYLVLSGDSEGLIQELMSLRFKYQNDGRRILVSKEEMKKQGVKSPNICDAAIYAASILENVRARQDAQYMKRPTEYKEESLWKIAGIR